MAFDKFPFAFDTEKFGEFFKMPEFEKMFDPAQLPSFDMDAMVAAQEKNLTALVEANKVAVAGYQDLFKRQIALMEEAMSSAKDQVAEMQAQPMSADQATKNVEALKVAFEKAAGDLKELTEIAQKANTEAFEIVKARVEEAMAEIKTATDKLAG